MDVERVFRMNGGTGDTSYSNNSLIQKGIAELMKDIILEAVQETYLTLRPKSLSMADLGCSSGSNAFLYINRLVAAVESVAGQEAPEFRVCLNDLPTNDFTTIFRGLPDLYQELKQGREGGEAPALFVAVYPGNFYSRLFPANSLHFVYSLSSLHWLSREDFGIFLKARSEEVETGGRMVLEITGRNRSYIFTRNNTILWELLYQSLHKLVIQGKIEEDLVDSYDVHYYEPSKEEIEDAVKNQISFRLDRLEMLVKEMNLAKYGMVLAKTVRAVQESMISHHFGEEILDDLFDEYGRLLEAQITNPTISITNMALVLTKL